MLRVVRAVSENEGKLEAINSYDSNFMSFGIFQWTTGTSDRPGEVAALLALLKKTDPAVFQEFFGNYKLDTAPGGVTAGFLTLACNQLKSTAAKAVLRDARWAYRFWRAGHHQGAGALSEAARANLDDRRSGTCRQNNLQRTRFDRARVVPAHLASRLRQVPKLDSLETFRGVTV